MADTPQTVSSYLDAGEEFSRQMPYHLEAEQSVLGAVLIVSGCLTTVLEYIRPKSFVRREHQELFSIMVAMFSAGQPIDFVTVLDRAVAENVFETIRRPEFIWRRLPRLSPPPPTWKLMPALCRKNISCAA